MRMQIPVCAVCGMHTDSVMHVLFYCQFSRVVWLISPLGIRSAMLPPDFIQTFLQFKKCVGCVLNFKLFLDTLWTLWKARCSYVYEGKQLFPASVLRVASDLSQTGLSLPKKLVSNLMPTLLIINVISYFVDGSYLHANMRGRLGQLWSWSKERCWLCILRNILRPFQHCALNLELSCWQYRLISIKEANLYRAVIVTDCKQLADAINSKEPPTHLDWRLYSEIIQIWLFVNNDYGVCCVFRGREYNGEAHCIANWVRTWQLQVSGDSYPLPLCM
jgi:hypothetical protein